jgi:hypothetical protein
MKVTGGCHCGQITYAAEVDPTTVNAPAPSISAWGTGTTDLEGRVTLSALILSTTPG